MLSRVISRGSVVSAAFDKAGARMSRKMSFMRRSKDVVTMKNVEQVRAKVVGWRPGAWRGNSSCPLLAFVHSAEPRASLVNKDLTSLASRWRYYPTADALHETRPSTSYARSVDASTRT